MQGGGPSGLGDVVRHWVLLLGLAFALNVVWELAQAPLYAGRPPTWVYARAAVTDAALIGLAAGAGLFVSRRLRHGFWAVLVLGLAASAVFIELRALGTDRWSYSESMPTVGPVGLSPLVQLPLLGVASVAIAWRGRRTWPQRLPDRRSPA